MYQALYRRYRPRTFEELLGQNHITTILKNQIKNNNTGHAYLFSGTRGTGKTSAAKILSRAVNCLSPIDGSPCNKCANCKEILEESTMDVIEMDAASNRGVDDIRDLRDKVIYAPAKIKYKVYIIDEVHMLTKEAFNALLKTLEEPPRHLIFILATTEPEKLPLTILSRCQRFDFRRISIKDLISNMKNILKDFDIEVDERVLNLIARNADGAMRDALSLLDQCISFNDKFIKYEDAINILGIANKDLFFAIVDHVKEGKLENALVEIDEVIQGGKDIGQFIKDLINHFRNLMISKSSKNPELIIEVDNMDKYIKQSDSLDINYILKALEILTEADVQAKWSTQARIILEMAIIKLVNTKNDLSLEERVGRLEQGLTPIKDAKEIVTTPRRLSEEKKADRKPAREESDYVAAPIKKTETEIPTSEETSEPPGLEDDGKELSLDIIIKEWPKVLQEINKKDVRAHAFLVEGEILSLTGNLLTIAYKSALSFHQQSVSVPHRKDLIEKIVSEYFNKNIRINFIISDNKPNNKKPREMANNDVNKKKAIEEVLNFFGEDIVEIK